MDQIIDSIRLILAETAIFKLENINVRCKI